MDDMLSLCGLWARKDKNGVEYYVGKLTYTTKLMVFKNKNKSGSKDPDYYITICKNEIKQPSLAQEPVKKETKEYDDVPF